MSSRPLAAPLARSRSSTMQGKSDKPRFAPLLEDPRPDDAVQGRASRRRVKLLIAARRSSSHTPGVSQHDASCRLAPEGTGRPASVRVPRHVSAASTAREQPPGGGGCAAGPCCNSNQGAVPVGQHHCRFQGRPALEGPHTGARPGHAQPPPPTQRGVHAMHRSAGGQRGLSTTRHVGVVVSQEALSEGFLAHLVTCCNKQPS